MPRFAAQQTLAEFGVVALIQKACKEAFEPVCAVCILQNISPPSLNMCAYHAMHLPPLQGSVSTGPDFSFGGGARALFLLLFYYPRCRWVGPHSRVHIQES